MPEEITESGVNEKDRGQVFKKYLWNAVHAAPIVLAFLIIIVFTTTNPKDSGVAGIFGVFVLVYLFFLSLFFSLIHAFFLIARRVGLRLGASRQRVYYIASVVALLPVFLLGLRSLGQLRVSDVLLIVSFCAIACFYVIRRSR